MKKKKEKKITIISTDHILTRKEIKKLPTVAFNRKSDSFNRSFHAAYNPYNLVKKA